MEMKKYLIMALAVLLLPACYATAQSKRGDKKAVSPYIEGRQKVRQTDYDSVWKFTSFDGKHKYYINYDYTQFASVTDAWRPNFGKFDVVMNYITRNPRAPLRLCAIYAVNPAIRDDAARNSLIENAKAEALESLQALQTYMSNEHMKTKMQPCVAQVDYRYWQGADFFTEPQTSEPLIKVGLILYFGTKKTSLFPSSVGDAPAFKPVKFFPNDATVQESWYPLLDEVAKCLEDNDRLEVLLTGYTDNQGTEAYVKGLSRQRATEVKKLLMARGVAEYRIEVDAKGSADPVGDNATYEGRVANNRCTITLQ